MKKIIAIILALGMSMALAACSGGSSSSGNDQDKTETTPAGAPESSDSAADADESTGGAADEIREHHFVLATTTDDKPGKTTGQHAYHVFEEKLTELSDGKMTSETSWGGALGNTAQLFSQVSEGTIDMTICGLDVLVGLKNAEDTAVFAVPYLFDDYDHIHSYLLSEPFQAYWKNVEDANNMVMVADLGPTPCRNLNTKEPVRSLADVENMKIRVAESQASIAVWTAWGANPVVLPASQMYSALENNQCDGWENQIYSFYSLKTPEVAPYITRINYVYQGNVVLMNKDIYNELNDAEKAVLQEAFDFAYQHNYDKTFGVGEFDRPEEDEEIEAMLAEPDFKGVFIPDDEIDLEGFKAKAKEVWYELEGDLYSEGLVDTIRGMVEP